MDQTARHRRIPTRNRTGWTSNQLNELSELFVEFSRSVSLPVLDIGAAFGIASIAAHEAGASVIANDLDPAHLEILRSRRSERFQLLPGRFPADFEFDAASLSAVHASNVLHFLTGAELGAGLRKIAQWLTPGGKLFVQASTPWQQPFASFVPVFEKRREEGAAWPGWIENTADYSRHRKLGQIPRSLNLLDELTLARHAIEAGLNVERCWLYRRRDLPASLFLDGRESLGLIAVR